MLKPASRTMKQGMKLIVVLAIVIQGTRSIDVCRDAVAPPSKPRGVNQISRSSDSPLFELYLKPMKHNAKTPYKISISIEDGQPFRFSEATIAVSTDGPCGSGEFDFKTDDYVEIVQEQDTECPRLIQTQRTTYMTQLQPLIWYPPSCGCVEFRVLLVESGEVYYAENEGVSSGPLAKTICFQKKQTTKVPRQTRLESLCHVIEKHSSGEIMARNNFHKYRNLELQKMDRLGIELALELRRSDVRDCCSKGKEEHKVRCFDDARRRRIDQFCEDGIPDIPFRTFRRSHMRKLEKSCCFIFGEFRYTCFSKNSQLTGPGKDTTQFDYSMDASDLVNDLADFGSHEHLDPYSLRPVGLGNEESEEENEDEFEEEEDDYETEIQENWYKDITTVVDDELTEKYDDNTANTNSIKKPSKSREIMNRERDNSPSDDLEPTSISSTSRSPLRNVLTKKALNKKLKKQSKLRNSQERRRGSSLERTKGQRRGNRRNGRRGSSERRERMRKPKRLSKEVYRKASSQERRANRRSRFEHPDRASGERQRALNQRRDKKDGWSDGVQEDRFLKVEYDFDDQGDLSMDRTLKKLQRKMQRLKIRNMCCKAGVAIGGQVYGGIGQVTDECSHSSLKYIKGTQLPHHWSKKCSSQFVDCCLEEAKKGLTMTSQEFMENTAINYWDNSQALDPSLMGHVLSQRGRQAPFYPAQRLDYSRDNSKQSHSSTPTGKNDKKDVFQRRFSLTQQKKDPMEGSSPRNRNEDMSPKLDEQNYLQNEKSSHQKGITYDNVGNDDRLEEISGKTDQREIDKKGTHERLKHNMAKASSGKSTSHQPSSTSSNVKPVMTESIKLASGILKGQEVIQTTTLKPKEEKQTKTDAKSVGEKIAVTEEIVSPNKSVKKRIIFVESKAPEESTRNNLKPSLDFPKGVEASKRKEAVEKDVDTFQQKGINVGNPINDEDKKEKSQHDNGEKGGSVITNDKQSSTNDHDTNIDKSDSKHDILKDVIGINKVSEKVDSLPTETITDRYSNKNKFAVKNSETRRTKKIKRPHRKQKRPSRRRYPSVLNRRERVGALDSREMAERNTRQYKDALDSREMADQYNRKSTDKFRRKNYKLYTMALRNRRRFRTG